MRIRVVGTSDSAISVRGMLNQDPTVVVSDVGYIHSVEITDTDDDIPSVDGVDCEMERLMVNRISCLANTDILLLRRAGIQSDQHIRIGVPSGNSKHLIERGIFQAILQLVNTNRYAESRRAEEPPSTHELSKSYANMDTSHADAIVAAAREEVLKAEARAEQARAEILRVSEDARSLAESRAAAALDDARNAEARAIQAKKETAEAMIQMQEVMAATEREIRRIKSAREEEEKINQIPPPMPVVDVKKPSTFERIRSWFE